MQSVFSGEHQLTVGSKAKGGRSLRRSLTVAWITVMAVRVKGNGDQGS